MRTLPEDGLIPIGSLPVAIEESPLLESLRDTSFFAEFRQEVARRRASCSNASQPRATNSASPPNDYVLMDALPPAAIVMSSWGRPSRAADGQK
jgi:hypothetical protein